MAVRDMTVSVPGGELAVRDHGGNGPDVLLLHPPVFSLELWSRLAQELAPEMRVVAWDLRGHAQSSAGLDGAEAVLDDIGAVMAATGLERPIVVGQDLSGVYAAAAVARAPERFGALVLLDSPALYDRDTIRDTLAVLSSDEVWADVVRRAAFGLRVPADRLDACVEELTTRFGQEWLVGEHDLELLRAGTRRSFFDLGDGTFVRRPDEAFMRWLVAPGPDWVLQGSRESVDALPLPVWAIRPDEGAYGQFGGDFGDVSGAYPRERREISGGAHTATTHPREVAEVLRELAATLPA